jgi:hypothetical protein
MDWIAWMLGRITREEYLYQKVRKQSAAKWWKSYDRAGR